MAEKLTNHVYDPREERLPHDVNHLNGYVSCESLLEAVLKGNGFAMMKIVAESMDELAQENLDRSMHNGSAQA